MTDRVRVLRVLEYEGPREWVEAAMINRTVKGERKLMGCIIRESIIGETAVVLSAEPQDEFGPGRFTVEAWVGPKPEPCPGPSWKDCAWPRCTERSAECVYNA